MANIRVHELARKIGKTSREVLQFLAVHQIDVKSHQSTLTPEQADMVQSSFEKLNQSEAKKGKEGKPEQSAEKIEKKESRSKLEGKNPEETNVEEKKSEKPEETKKPNITRVFHPQNSNNKNVVFHPQNSTMKPQRRPAKKRPEEQKAKDVPAEKKGGAIRKNPEEHKGIPAPIKAVEKAVEKLVQKTEQKVAAKTNPAVNAEPKNAAKTAGSAEQKNIAKPTANAESKNVGKPAGSTEQKNAARPAANAEQKNTSRSGAEGRNSSRSSQHGYEKRSSNSERNQNRGGRSGSDGRNRTNRFNNGEGRGENRGGNRFNNGEGRGENRGGNRFNNGDGRNNRDNKGGRFGGGNRGMSNLDRGINKMYQEEMKPSGQERNKKNQNDKERDRERENRKNNKNSGHEDLFYGKGQKNNTKKKPAGQPKKPEKKEETIKNIIIPESLTVRELGEKMKVSASEIIKKLFLQGKVVTVNQEIDFDQAEEIALEFNCIAELEEKVDVIEELLREEEEDESKMVKRSPVVCVMGHVDHGKTSLLDAIRNSHVIDREAGGITQHIGAYVVDVNGDKITFLDTPGHEAFTAMRMRGANSTDIAILVVAADDGVMPQTVEAINHAKAAGVEIIVAVNKIDKPGANIERVKQELSEYQLISEDWGGTTIFVPVSAKTHEGIDNLLEMILLTAEMCELKANPKRNARGLIIEAKIDKGKGTVATVLVQKGTLKVGDPIAAGPCYGKVRAMMDDKGRRVKKAGPSTPVEILGLSDVPEAGETFVAFDNEKEARSFSDAYVSQNKAKLIEDSKMKMSLDDLFSQIQAGNLKELNLILKADVQGSVEALKQSLLKLSNEEVVVKIIHAGVGAINESDVSLASASNAIIIGFNIRVDAMAKSTAEHEGVDVRLYKVIYNAIEDIQSAMKGMLEPVYEEKVLGHAEIRQIFKSSQTGKIAGSYVLDGVFERDCSIRLSREGEQIYEGKLASLKRFKDDVKEVKAGFECGLVFEGFDAIEEGDSIEAYTMVEVERK